MTQPSEFFFALCPALAMAMAIWLAWRAARDVTFEPLPHRQMVGIWGGLFLSGAVCSTLIAVLIFSGWRYASHLLALAAAAGVMYLPLTLSRDFSGETEQVPLFAFVKSAMSVGVCFAALAGLMVLRMRA